MKYSIVIATLLLSLPMCSCAPDDDVPPSPPAEYPEEPTPPPSTSNTMKITAENTAFTATLAPNATTAAFLKMLPLTLHMSDYNNNEKVCSLPNSLPTAAANPGTIRTGDIMLYGSSSLVLFYETFPTSYSYTRIGWIDNPAALKAALGAEDTTIKFEL